MTRVIAAVLVLCMVSGCGGQGDDSSEYIDNRECIVFIDVTGDNTPNELGEEADNAGVQLEAVGGNVEACGTSYELSAFIGALEVSDEPVLLELLENSFITGD